jgi:hypothetical protein
VDNTVVATFHDNAAAEIAKRELLECGLGPQDISAFIDTATHTPEGLLQKVKSYLHEETKLRSFTILTVYAGLHLIDRAKDILSRNGAVEIQVHRERKNPEQSSAPG